MKVMQSCSRKLDESVTREGHWSNTEQRSSGMFENILSKTLREHSGTFGNIREYSGTFENIREHSRIFENTQQ